MSRVSGQKLKLLYVLKMLYEKTDEEHAVTVNDIIAELQKHDISAERKSIYDDIETLIDYKVDIVKRKTKTHDYYLASREFQLVELKLLIDSVQSSKFITQSKSMELIEKLEKFASVYQVKRLKRQLYVQNRIKTMNESIYYNVDAIHQAISETKQISFKYFDWSPDKERVYRKDGNKSVANPIALTFDNSNYYLITYNSKWKSFIHYRVDKMDKIEITEDKADIPDTPFNLTEYIKPVFSMYDGDMSEVTMRFDNSLAGVVIDRFGRDVYMHKEDENNFVVHTEIAVSPIFLSWIIGFGNKAKVISPKIVADQVYNLAVEAANMYK